MITILIPAYNEEAVITVLLEELQRRVTLEEAYEILVVNDGSSDATPQLLSVLQQSA